MKPTDEDDRTEHHRRAEVALHEARPGTEPGDEHQREQRATRVGHLLVARRQDVGGQRERGELQHLRRLEAPRPDRHPRSRTVDRGPQAGRERQHHPGRGEDRDRHGERSPAPVRHLDRDQHPPRARSRPTSAAARRSGRASCPPRPRWPPTRRAPSRGRASRTRRRRRRSRSRRPEVARARSDRPHRGCAWRGGWARSLQALEGGLASLGRRTGRAFVLTCRLDGIARGSIETVIAGPLLSSRPPSHRPPSSSSTVTSTRSATSRRKWSPRRRSHRSGTSRSSHSPATGPPRRHVRCVGGRQDSGFHRVRPHHRAMRCEEGSDLVGRLADRHDRSESLRLGRHRRQIEPLVAAAGDQHDVLEAVDRHRDRVRCRRLRIVEPLHAVALAERLDPVRRADECRRSPGRRFRGRRDPTRTPAPTRRGRW